MCYSRPGQIVEIVDPANRLGRVDFSGQQQVVNLGLLPEDEVAVGQWVLVQAGLAVEHVNEEDVQEILDLIELINRYHEEE